MLKLQIIITSTRPGRIGLPIGNWFYEFAKKENLFETELVDLKEINLPFFDEPELPRFQKYTQQHTKDWSTKIQSADAYVFILPEYNYSIPATFKNALDYLLNEWQYKPVGLVNYGGMSAGTRSAQMAKQVITAVNMMPIAEAVNISFARLFIKEDKFIPDEKLETMAKNMLTKLSIWAKHLRELREEITKPQ
jgi:NAD(P)H-dependent FMN reductase